MKRIVYIAFLALLIANVQAVGYKVPAGPWTVEFNSSQNLKTQIQYGEPDDSGISYWIIQLVDEIGHEVASITLFSSPILKEATNEFLDGQLDVGIKMLRVDSPTKTSIAIDGTQGRLAEGYASKYSRKWHEIVYPYKPFFDSFTNITMMRGWITFESLQDPAQFEEIVGSLHINKAE
jgi:hypothetical protein